MIDPHFTVPQGALPPDREPPCNRYCVRIGEDPSGEQHPARNLFPLRHVQNEAQPEYQSSLTISLAQYSFRDSRFFLNIIL